MSSNRLLQATARLRVCYILDGPSAPCLSIIYNSEYMALGGGGLERVARCAVGRVSSRENRSWFCHADGHGGSQSNFWSEIFLKRPCSDEPAARKPTVP